MTAGEMWGVVEIMGRRQRSGRLTDATLGGATLLRIEHPNRTGHDDEPLVEYYSAAAIFAIRPCSQEEAEKHAAYCWPGPRAAIGPGLAPELEDLVDDEDDDLDDDGEPF